MEKIVLIVCWFGKLRDDFVFWLKSVERNSTIDFLIFTDQEIEDVPVNCRIIRCSLSYIEQLAQKHVWEGCKISTAYKCCDFRPAFGLMFQEYIKEYDFWGHCDTDMIFGDIRYYFPHDRLEKYDRLGQNGPLSIYRNIAEVNNVFKKDPEYKQIFSSIENIGFDEWGQGRGITFYWLKHLSERIDTHIDFDNLQPYHYSFISGYVENKKNGMKNLMFSFEDGKLFRYGTIGNKVIKDETLYVHIQKRPIEIHTQHSEYFSIIPPCSFISFVSDVDRNYLRWHVCDGKFWAYYTRFRNKLNKLLGKNEWKNTVLLPNQDLW